MILTYQYRILPTKAQHGVLAAILESQRQLYNAALEERIGAYRRGVTRTYFDQSKALTEWRQSDPDAVALRIRVAQRSLTRKQHARAVVVRREFISLAVMPQSRVPGRTICMRPQPGSSATTT